MTRPAIPFLIAITKDSGAFAAGDVTFAKHDGEFFLTANGPVNKAYARVVNGLELVTFRHRNGTVKFRQYARDEIPPWATNLRLDTGDQ